MGYLVQSYLDESARRSPCKTSIGCNGETTDYDRLFRRSNRLARCLKSNGVSRQDRVCIVMNRSIGAIEAIMGTLKADAVYVPIDPKSPPERWRRILTDCRPSAVICDGKTAKTFDAASDMKRSVPVRIVLGNDGAMDASDGLSGWSGFQQVRTFDGRCPDYGNIDTDLAYILYTSGSTGSPKGVMISHLNIRNYIEWAIDCFAITGSDRILGTAPFHFDMSTFDIYCTLKAGATLVIATESQMLFPMKLVGVIESEEITLWKGISSLLMYMARTRSLQPGGMPTLRKVLFGGEPLQTRYAIDWMTAFPEKAFYNVYGPTEATGISAFYHLDHLPEDPDDPIPIGRACRNTEVLLLKTDDAEAAPGETGEVCLRGSGLSRGYWGDPSRTRASFVANPLTGFPEDRIYRTGDIARRREDGVLEFIGRTDHQVKYMGYRIDLNEIETAMASTPGVGEAAVIPAGANGSHPDELIGFYDSDADTPVGTILLRLNECLPAYMIPRRLIPLARIPRNDRGKVDRHALRGYVFN